VLDPFSGSGTTCVAALMNGRNYIGIDLNPDYCELARERIETAMPATCGELEV
jgi:site-specific DNA-methyltransferase (adenine-specific)